MSVHVYFKVARKILVLVDHEADTDRTVPPMFLDSRVPLHPARSRREDEDEDGTEEDGDVGVKWWEGAGAGRWKLQQTNQWCTQTDYEHRMPIYKCHPHFATACLCHAATLQKAGYRRHSPPSRQLIGCRRLTPSNVFTSQQSATQGGKKAGAILSLLAAQE